MLYEFEATNRGGKVVKAVVEAQHEDEVVEKLRARGDFPLRVHPAPKGSTPMSFDDLPEPFSLAQLPTDQIEKKLLELKNGSETAYPELLKILEQAIEQARNHSDEIAGKAGLSMLEPLRKSLLEAGSAAEASRQLRENQQRVNEELARAIDGDVEMLKRRAFKIGPGWLTSAGDRKGLVYKNAYGDMYILSSKALMFHEFAAGATAVKLCVPREVALVSMGGFWTKKIQLRTMSGGGWNFEPQWRNITPAQKSEIKMLVRNFKMITQEHEPY